PEVEPEGSETAPGHSRSVELQARWARARRIGAVNRLIVHWPASNRTTRCSKSQREGAGKDVRMPEKFVSVVHFEGRLIAMTETGDKRSGIPDRNGDMAVPGGRGDATKLT